MYFRTDWRGVYTTTTTTIRPITFLAFLSTGLSSVSEKEDVIVTRSRVGLCDLVGLWVQHVLDTMSLAEVMRPFDNPIGIDMT